MLLLVAGLVQKFLARASSGPAPFNYNTQQDQDNTPLSTDNLTIVFVFVLGAFCVAAVAFVAEVSVPTLSRRGLLWPSDLDGPFVQ